MTTDRPEADVLPLTAAPVDEVTPPTPAGQPPATVSASDSGTTAATVISPAAEAPGPSRPKIQVGSKRFVVGDHPRGRRPRRGTAPPEQAGAEQTAAALVDRPRATVPRPSRRDPLSPELEQELNATLSGASLDELVGLGRATPQDDSLEIDSRHRATVLKVHGDSVFFTLGGRHEGAAPLRQFKEPPAIGTPLDVIVTGFNVDEGLYDLTVPGGSVDVHDWDDLVEGSVVEARVTGANTGGLECMVGHVRGFIPSSQIAMYRVENYAEFYEKKLLCVVTEANKRRRNLVLSHRAVLERQKEEERQKLIGELEVGQVREGVVRSVRDFGAFVDLGGVDGLIHISQLSWERVKHPSEILQEGQKVRVKIEKINTETGKVGLSYRDLLDHPWTNIDQRFPVDAMVKGTVSRTAKFGAFVKLAPGVEGLIHISELAHHRVVQVTNVVKEGDEVEVKILSVDPHAQRIALSLKAAHPLPESETPASEEEPDEPPRELAVLPRNQPLKGGTNRATGGDKFGLNW
jgi:small subunit ribosomal protein S1